MTAAKYISGEELAALIKNPEKVAKKDYLVVDVRDDDYEGGNIKGSLNMPSKDFLMNVDTLVKDTKDVGTVIFHCSLSQVRGPKAARVYQETRQNVLGKDESSTNVYILRDGFSQFQVKYKDDPELVENWDENVWASEWS
ncbi:Rhodanese-like protein [Marasmius fiardii PR-910]|nr:Rhodanese-like protein [Marasmius fiardii PR-910]